MNATIKKTRQIDMLHGPLAGRILQFAAPVALTGILQQLFNAADVAVVGRFVGTEAMAAVGSNSAVVGLLVNLFVGVALGANVVIAGFTGAGDIRDVHRGVHTAVIVSVLAGFLMMIIGQLIAGPLLRLLGVPDNIMGMAQAYLRIYLLGLPVIFLYNFEAAIFRSQGDTRTPLICLVVSGIVNVILNLFFVIVVGMTASGVALATVIANIVSSMMMFVKLLHTDSEIRIRKDELHIDKSILKKILYIGVPAGVQGMVFSISNLCIQSGINSLGSDIIAASAAAFNVEIVAYFIVNSFSQACTTFIGQNRGARQMERCRSVLKVSLIMETVGALLIALVLILPGKQILSVFNSDPAVAEYGMIRLIYVVGFEFINGYMDVMSGCMRGHGHSMGPALMTLIGVCGTRILWVLTVFRRHPSFKLLMIVYPVSWVITSLALTILYFSLRKKLYDAELVAPAV